MTETDRAFVEAIIQHFKPGNYCTIGESTIIKTEYGFDVADTSDSATTETARRAVYTAREAVELALENEELREDASYPRQAHGTMPTQFPKLGETGHKNT